MLFVRAKIEQEKNDATYKIYMTDALKCIAGLNIRWFDLIDDEKTVDNRTGDEIAFDIIQKAGLIVGGEKE